MQEILFFTEGVNYPSCFSDVYIKKWLNIIAGYYGKKLGNLSFIFCNDEYILEVNRKYLNHDYYTDVITFDYCSDEILSGDIFISLDTVKSNAGEFEVSFENEFNRVICHSVLHLIGFKDKTYPDSVIMRRNEDVCLELFKTV